MELVLQGWIDTYDGDICLAEDRDRLWASYSLAEQIMNCFNYNRIDRGLGEKLTMINGANLRCWFSDEEVTLEEAQMNFDCYMETGQLFTKGHYVGYSEYTITSFSIDDLIIGGHDLNAELRSHMGQYCHFILTDYSFE